MRRTASEMINDLEIRIARLEREASRGASFTVTSSKSEDLQGWGDEGLMDYTDEIVTGEEKATTKTLMSILSEMTPSYDEWDEVSYEWQSTVVMPGRDIILEVNFLRNARERDYIINLGNSEYFSKTGQNLPENLIRKIEKHFEISRRLRV
jgi:hypothetical protein